MSDETQAAIIEFAFSILHGTSEHRFWLIDAAVAFTKGEPIPELRR